MPDKLEERLRSSAAAFREHPVYDSEGDGCYLGVQADELSEAADEITRLKGEVERLTALCAAHHSEADDLGEQANRWRNEWGEAQALIDELVKGLSFYRDEWQKAQHPFGMAGPAMTPTHRLLCDYGERAEALISKARSSGKAGSDA